MGGGTTVVEAMIRGRYGVGCDLNSLAVFVARAKTARLSEADVEALKRWADNTVPALSYWLTPDDIDDFICQRRTKNLTLPEARPIKKVLALALRSLSAFSTEAECLARCALLNTGQWALNGRTRLERVNLRNHLFAVNGERYRGRKPVFEVVAPVLLKARDGANEGISKTPGLHALVFTALMDANGKPNTGQEQFESREEAALHQDTTAKTLHVVLVHPSPPM